MAKNPTIEELYGQANISPAQQFKQQYPGVSDIVAEAKVAEGWTPTGQKKPVSLLSTENAVNNLQASKKQFDQMAGQPVPPTEQKPKTETAQPQPQPQPQQAQPAEGGLSFEDAYELFGNDFTGVIQKDGKYYPDASAYERIGITGIETGEDIQQNQLEADVAQATAQIENLYNDFLSYNVENDPAFQSQARLINSQFAKLRRNMEQVNESRQRQLETLGMRTGASRYAGSVQMGIEGEELSQANERIADINLQEQQAIASARQAYETGQYQKFAMQADMLKDLRSMKQEALTNYNNKLIAVNEALQAQQKFDFEVNKFLADEQWRNNQLQLELAKMAQPEGLMTLTPGQTVFDPNTGEALFSVPKPVDTSAPEIKSWGGMVHQWDTNSQNWITLGSEEAPGQLNKLVTVNGKTFVQKPDGTLEEPQVPQIVNQQTITFLQDKLDIFDEVFENKQGLKRAVGEYAIKRWTPFTADKAEFVDFVGKVEQLTSQETINTLLDLKKAGGTLGALSDQERIMLQNAATAIGNWKIVDKKTGKVKGYEVSEDTFIKEIKRLQDLTEKALKEAGGGLPAQSFDDFYLNADPSILNQIDKMINDTNLGETEQERKQNIMDYFQGDTGQNFSQVAPDTNIGNIKIGAGIAKRTNNPGNLVYIGQAGAKKDPQSRFAMFDTPEQGFQALVNDLRAKQTTKGRLNLGPDATLAQLITVYAPPSENATQQYIQQIASALNISPNTKLSQIDTLRLAKAIAKKESSTIIT